MLACVAHITSFSLKGHRAIAVLALFLFLNFTFSLQYINCCSDNSTLTEIVEEVEEEAEYENDVFELLLNNTQLIQLVSYQLEDEPFELRFINDIQTPPPEFA